MIKKFLAFFCVALFLLSPLLAFKASSQSKTDIQRFGLNQVFPKPPLFSAGASSPYIYSYNHSHFPNHAVGVRAVSPSFSSVRPKAVADAFLSAVGKNLNLNPAELQFLNENSGLGHMHALYQQTYQGLPVEFSRVKVQMDSTGAVLRLDSNFLPNIQVNTVPSIPSSQAAQVVAQDSGGTPVTPTLVIFPDLNTSAPHLAWRFLVRKPQHLWRYYVDAKTGQVLLRYDVLESSGFSGNVQGMVFDVDPYLQSQTSQCSGVVPPCLIPRPFENEWLYVGGPSYRTSTDQNGNYSSSQNGEIFTMLQGQYVDVASYFGANASYENEGGVWGVTPESVSFGPSPASTPGGIISSQTISIPLSLGAVGFLPVFSKLNVGVNFSASGENFGITTDDELLILDSNGNVIASYVGNLTPSGVSSFGGTMSVGNSESILLAEQPASPGGDSYSIVSSSYLVLSNPTVTGSNNNVVWAATMTPSGMEGELSLYYHLNLQHDFFSQVLGPTLSAEFLSGRASALAFFGPNMTNAFYDPQDDNVWFGDGGATAVSQGGNSIIDIMTDDATVPHHELTHYLVQKIWPITNFGQSGAISEGNADFWSANSLNDPGIGYYVNGENPAYGPVRNLCGSSTDSNNGCASFGGMVDSCRSVQPAVYSSSTWTGEIHCDGEYFSQSMWEIRGKEIARYGACTQGELSTPPSSPGNQLNCPAISCISQLEMNALLFFPESYEEMEQALLDVNSMGLASACSFTSSSNIASDIITSFQDHGINLCSYPQINSNDPYCNSGFETALDVSTLTTVTATLYPAGEQDFYTFAAAPGPISITLNLSSSTSHPGYYKGYQMTLLDSNHDIITTAAPSFNGLNTLNGYCLFNDCEVTASSVQLNYASSGGRFFLDVTGGNDGSDSVSGASSLNPYTLYFSFPQINALSANVVNAAVNQDLISFQVSIASNVSASQLGSVSHLQTPQYFFAYAQLRDQSQNILPNTQTYPASSSNYLTFVSSTNGNGQISGSVQIQNNFSARFPAVGTVYLEVFAYDIAGSTVSMGLSGPLNLGTSQTDASAWNNLFNPLKGQEATIKYQIQQAGHVTVKVYTMNGEEVATLFDGNVAAGAGSVNWDGKNLRSYVVASGIYLVRVTGPGLSKILKVAVVK